MCKITVFCRATADSITLFWDKPEHSAGRAQYELFVDGRPTGGSDRTHFTVTGLMPDPEYSVDVRLGGTTLGHCVVRTGPRLQRLDVRDFGAAGDGETMDTGALQKAIDACRPGQEVYLPAGIYRTGSLRLHSHMALYLEEDAVLQGTDQPEDYLPRIRSRFEGTEMECYSSLLNLGELDHSSGSNCRDVLIYGKGTIASGGQRLASRIIESERERLKDYLAANAGLVATCENDRTIPGRVRPRLINLSNCQNVRITGLTLKNGASWNVHMIYSDNIVTDHCTFLSEGVWNGDGWDPDSSTNCTLFASRFYTGDDAVAIKSGKNPEGNTINRPSRHIRVFDCISFLGHGICMGSEMSGGIEDVDIWDCDLANSSNGIEIKGTKKRGGYVRGIRVRDCSAPRVMIHSVGYNDDGVPAPQPPIFENFRFERLRLTGRALDGEWGEVVPIELVGFDVPGHELQKAVFQDCSITGGLPTLRFEHCGEITLEGMSFDAQ